MIVKGELRKYLGAISSEEHAARFYDKYSIIIQGLEVSSLNIFKLYRQKQISVTHGTKLFSFSNKVTNCVKKTLQIYLKIHLTYYLINMPINLEWWVDDHNTHMTRNKIN